jgi:mono/diheme cytochrome c family protein
MRRLRTSLLITAFLSSPIWAQSLPSQAPADDAALRDLGKQVFTSQCGKCHDADAAKKLPDGSTLLARLAASKDMKTLLSTRTKKMSPQDAQGVHLYIEDLVAKYRASQSSPEHP